jgi:OmpA-OmpF porin, OOP family
MKIYLYYFRKLSLFLPLFLLLSSAVVYGQKKSNAPKAYVSPYYTYDDDGDGVPNYRDKCVNTPKGEKVTPFGCPFDSDFDGVFDYEDDCDSIKGPRSNKGCPIVNLDTDNDKILDVDDLCPDVPGVKKNRGCPEIKEEDSKALKAAFDNLLFETGKDIIRESSFESLNLLAGVLVNNPKYKLHLEGHTDNVGDDQANYILSQNRALAVRKYLAKKGVNESRVIPEWYGETKPKTTNDTSEGRQLNRRVEMNIIY